MSELDVVFESLRRQAESNIKSAGKRPFRWAPALVLGDDILATLADLQHPPLDKNVARLWASFDQANTVTVFALHLGTDHRGECVLRAAGGWQISRWIGGQHPTMPMEFWQKLRHTRKNVERLRESNDTEKLPEAEAALAELEQANAEFWVAREAHRTKIDLFNQLILQRLADFARDPIEEMAAGARVTGHCGICGRLLTDPVSVARGVGPECFGRAA